MDRNMVGTALNGIALALGVAVVVLGILDTLAAGTAFSLLGIAVIALGIAALQRSGS